MFGLKKMTKTQQLQHLAAEINRPEEFKPGDLVVWKDGMMNKKIPAIGEVVVVTQVLKEPIVNPAEAGSAYFQEPLDLVLGRIDGDGDFIEYYYDRRRFTHA